MNWQKFLTKEHLGVLFLMLAGIYVVSWVVGLIALMFINWLLTKLLPGNWHWEKTFENVPYDTLVGDEIFSTEIDLYIPQHMPLDFLTILPFFWVWGPPAAGIGAFALYVVIGTLMNNRR